MPHAPWDEPSWITIQGEQVLIDHAAVWLDAGSQPPGEGHHRLKLKMLTLIVKTLLTDTLLVLHATYLVLYNKFHLYMHACMHVQVKL